MSDEDKINKSKLLYEVLDSDELHSYIVNYINILSSDFIRAGEGRISHWEAGWKENLEEFKKTLNPSSLIPKYHKKNNIARLNKQIIKTHSKDFDYHLHSFFVDALLQDTSKAQAALLAAKVVDAQDGKPGDWTEPRQFNLMFSTEMGAVSGEGGTLYLRPETAQGIFVNFLNVQKSGRMKIPFGIAQTGKAFRNEIVARQFIFRMREFEQMEMQYFVAPGTDLEWYATWKAKRLAWHHSLGLGADKYRFHDHLKLAHYANAACDIEYRFPFGFKELEGIHSRTDFDLTRHEQFSGRKLRYFDTESEASYVPYVIETSIGLDRLFLATLAAAYTEEKLEDGSERVVLRLPAFVAPVQVALLPLIKKDGLPELARQIQNSLRFRFLTQYDEKDSIGKRYRRQDALGTPVCLTIDHQSLEDHCVTLRHRDSMQQERIPIAQIHAALEPMLSIESALEGLVG